MTATDSCRRARDLLLDLRADPDRAREVFEWPELGDTWSSAVDWFDAVARGSHRPALMIVEEDGRSVACGFDAMTGGCHHTGDEAARDEDGDITFVARSDDVLTASAYKIIPFELESVLIEHPAVAEAAVVPVPDPVREWSDTDVPGLRGS